MKTRFLILLLVVSAACATENHVILLNITKDQQSTSVKPQLNFTTSQQIKEAIDSGIRIYIIAKVDLFEPRQMWFDKTIKQQRITLEISYFTLGKHYKIKNLNSQEQIGVNDYPQLWKEIEKLLVFQFSNDLITDKSWVKLRVMLDKGALPIAMQLPVLFDSHWDINTDWHEQKVKQK